jgi:hypothetical protein
MPSAPRPFAGALAILLLAAAIGLGACGGSSSDPRTVAAVSVSTEPGVPNAAAHGCPSPAAVMRARRQLRLAKMRFRIEARGSVIHADLRYIAHNRILLDALRSGNLVAARAEIDRLQHSQIVKHVTRIRIVRGAHVLIDGWPTSFDVGGSEMRLRSGGRRLGRVQITVQDIIGFIKLEHRHNATEVLVRGADGQVRTLLAAAKRVPLPLSGCAWVGGRRYVVSSFKERGFTGEPIAIWLLSAA